MFQIQSIIPTRELPHFGVMEGVFGQEEVSRIKFFEKVLDFEDGKTVDDRNADGKAARTSRVCQTAHFSVDDNTQWLWEKVAQMSGNANYDLFLYKLTHIETLQYTIYEGSEEGKYDWHRDGILYSYCPHGRKITGIIMLSDPDEYEGGDLELDVDGTLNPISMRLNKGDCVFFDALMSHRVTPVTSGRRDTLVFWLHGEYPTC